MLGTGLLALLLITDGLDVVHIEDHFDDQRTARAPGDALTVLQVFLAQDTKQISQLHISLAKASR